MTPSSGRASAPAVVEPAVAGVFRLEQLDADHGEDAEEESLAVAVRQEGQIKAAAGGLEEDAVQGEQAGHGDRQLQRQANALALREVSEHVAADLPAVQREDGQQVEQSPVEVDEQHEVEEDQQEEEG